MNTAQNYRKKPVVIQAIKLERDNIDAAYAFAFGRYLEEKFETSSKLI